LAALLGRPGASAQSHEERFVDLPPAQVWAQLLDASYVPPCSIRTMYRVLAANAEVRERHNQPRHAWSPPSSARIKRVDDAR
jgi:hypothetical protein